MSLINDNNSVSFSATFWLVFLCCIVTVNLRKQLEKVKIINIEINLVC